MSVNDNEPLIYDSITWPNDHVEKLISRMKQHIPSSDSLRHQSRAARLPWDLIAFEHHSELECQHMYKLVLQRVRGFRLLEEILNEAEVWIKNPWTDFYGGKSKNRHPDMPKKPLTSYLLFFQDQVKTLKEEMPELSVIEMSKIIGEKFRNLKEKRKAKYIKRAELSKQEYERKMELFLAEHPSERKKMSKSSNNKKITAFKLYMEDQIQTNPEANEKPLKELFVFFRQQWENLPENEKLPWLLWAEKKQKEIEELSDFVKTNTVSKSVLTKKEKDICDRAGKPVKPPRNIYILFTRMMHRSEDILSLPSKDRMKEISTRWKALAADKREELKYQLEEKNNQYKEEVNCYLKENPHQIANFVFGRSKPMPKKFASDFMQSNGTMKSVEKTVLKQPKSETTPTSSSETDVIISKKRKSVDHETELPKKKKTLDSTNTSTEYVSENINNTKKNSLFEGEPKQPPESPILLFKKAMKKSKVKYSSEEQLNEAWRNLSGGQRKSYKKALKEAQENYAVSFEAFFTSLSKKDRKKYIAHTGGCRSEA